MDILKTAKEGKNYSRIMQDVGINFKKWEILKHQLYDAGLLRMYIGRIKQKGAWPSNGKRQYDRKYETTQKGLMFLGDYQALKKQIPFIDC